VLQQEHADDSQNRLCAEVGMRTLRKFWIATIAALGVAAIIAIVFFLPPLDLVFDKIMKVLVR